MARAAGWPRDVLVRVVARCFEVERRLKANEGDPRALLTILVAEVAGA
jgi:hypothetical protein